MKRYLVPLLKLLISVGILSWLFSKAWRENQLQAFFEADKNWLGIACAFAACLAAHLISFFRWQLFVRAINLPFTFADALRIGFIGLFFNLFAFGVIGGDALRAFYVTRQIRHRVAEAIASVILDRFIGVLTMFSIAAIAFLCWDPRESQLDSESFGVIRFIGLTATTGAGVGLLFMLSMIFTPWIAKTQLFTRLVGLPVIGKTLEQVAHVVLAYRSKPPLIAIGFLLSLAVNGCFLIAIYLVADSITDSHPSLAAHFLIEPISMVANAVPLPGGIGGMELVLGFLYEAFSADQQVADFGIVVALGFRFMLLLVSALGAVIWFFNRKTLKTELKQSAPAA